MNKKLKIGVVGVTGMVGQSFIEILEAQKFAVEELRGFASESSKGKSVTLQGQSYPIQVLGPNCFQGLDLVFFSSGDDISLEWAPQAVQQGAWAIDNSAAFRMSDEHFLIVPEVNGDLIETARKKPQVIANPNCSTIQLVVALQPLLKKFGISDVRVASYQAVSGAGQAAFDELKNQVSDPLQKAEILQHRIAYNVIPQIGSFGADGFTSEETKIRKETKKILRAPQMKVSAMTVRVPVLNGHSEAVWVTLNKVVTRDELIAALKTGEGLIVEENQNQYPLPIHASGADPVYVGRIHQDLEDPKTWLMWVVADNVRKGAALNGMQIAQKLFL